MRKFDFDTLVNRYHTNCVKWDRLNEKDARLHSDVLPLWVADMDFPCAEGIQKALQERVAHPIYGYSHATSKEYEDAICGWFQRRFRWTIEPTDLFYSPGVVPAVSFLISILSQAGEGIIIQEPLYHPFRQVITANHRKVVNSPLVNDRGVYHIDFADLEAKMAVPDNVGMILCSPHNPIGRVWTAVELNQIVDLAVRYDKWIIADEIHCDIIRKGITQLPVAKLRPDALDRIIVCTAPSKSFNIAGLKTSSILIHNPRIKELWKQEVGGRLHLSAPNVFAQAVTIAAYNECEEWLNHVNDYIDDNITTATRLFQERLPKAIVSPCEGTYLLWVDLRAYCHDPHELETKMRSKIGVFLNEGYQFGEGGAGFERINMACPRSVVIEAITRICEGWRDEYE